MPTGTPLPPPGPAKTRAFKKRLAWRSEWESLDQARKEISGYVDGYQQRPHSPLAYRTPAEVAATWRPDPEMLQTPAT